MAMSGSYHLWVELQSNAKSVIHAKLTVTMFYSSYKH